jgi:hypothetical protein
MARSKSSVYGVRKERVHIERCQNRYIRIPHSELVARYRKKFRIDTDAVVTAEMVLNHWTLERRLTLELLASTPENRWPVFQRCYTELYGKLEWLNRLTGINRRPNEERFADWTAIIGTEPKRI